MKTNVLVFALLSLAPLAHADEQAVVGSVEGHGGASAIDLSDTQSGNSTNGGLFSGGASVSAAQRLFQADGTANGAETGRFNQISFSALFDVGSRTANGSADVTKTELFGSREKGSYWRRYNASTGNDITQITAFSAGVGFRRDESIGVDGEGYGRIGGRFTSETLDRATGALVAGVDGFAGFRVGALKMNQVASVSPVVSILAGDIRFTQCALLDRQADNELCAHAKLGGDAFGLQSNAKVDLDLLYRARISGQDEKHPDYFFVGPVVSGAAINDLVSHQSNISGTLGLTAGVATE